MAKKTNRLAFTEAVVKGMKPPAAGRVWYYDSKTPGLALMVTAAGASSFYFYKWHDGKPMRVLLGKHPDLAVKQAQEAAREMVGKIASGGDPQADRRRRREEPTLADLHAHWMIYATSHKRPRSVAEDKRVFDRLITSLASRRLGTIKKSDIQALHATIGQKNGIYAANRTLALLRSMFNKADEIGFNGANPAAGIKAFKEESRDRFLQPSELEAFFVALEAEEPIFRDYFLTCLLTGARKTNVMEMKWLDLDLAAGFWRIPQTKGGTVVIVPLVAPAVAILASRHEERNGSEWVFPGRRPGSHLTEPDKAWDRIRERAKLKDLRIHDLRRSLGSWMAGQNVSLTIIGKVLGHKTPQATMIYSRLAMDPQRHAMDAATTAMLTAGKQNKLLTIDVEAKEAGNNE